MCVLVRLIVKHFLIQALVLGLTLAGKKRGIQSSGSLFIFWFFLTFCGVFTYISRIKSISDGVC